MISLVNSVTWKAKEHLEISRGMARSGAGLLSSHSPAVRVLHEDLIEQCTVMTRRQLLLVFNLSRTSVFHPSFPKQGGILWWNTKDEGMLAKLHQLCVQICAEVGFSEFCVMCEARGPSAPPYWEEMLGENYRWLRKHS